MKKVLGIVASKRKLGNCEIMVKEISRRIPIPHELRLLRLPDFSLGYCTGCYRCLFNDSGCVLKDDLAQVLDAISAADALILAVPTYILSAPACLKTFLDRSISFYAMAERLWGKPTIGVGIAGLDGMEGATLLDIERFFAIIQAKNQSSRIVYGALPGEVMLAEENGKVAEDLATALFSQTPTADEWSCSYCGGKTFRFFGGNRVRCMLCSCTGQVTLRDGLAIPEMNKDEHQFVLGENEALRHRDMLLSIRERFESRKSLLKELVAGYTDEGTWILPGNP